MNPRLCHLALGSNVGDRTATIEAAITSIDALEGVRVTARSQIIETKAVVLPGSEPQRAYRNAAITIETSIPLRNLLEQLQQIEQALGRDRTDAGRWAPRTIDIDILLDGETVIDEPGLTVPHPRMHERRFVLEPLVEIAPETEHPNTGRTIRDMLTALAALCIVFATIIGRSTAQDNQVPPAQPIQPEALRLDPDEVFRNIADAYRAGPIAERVTISATAEFRQREETAVVYLDAPRQTAMLELGPLRAIARDGELLVTHEWRGDRYARFTADGRNIAALIAESLPPLPMPHLALAFDDPQNPTHLIPFPGEIAWTDAIGAPDQPHIVLLGASPDARVSLVLNSDTWRLQAGVITVPESRLTIEMRFEPIEPGDPAQWTLDLAGKSPVPTLAQLRPGGVDMQPGAAAPPMVFFTISSQPWRMDLDHEGPLALLFFREISPAVLAARDSLAGITTAHDPPIPVQPVVVTDRLIGIDLFERLGQTVYAYGQPILWTASPEVTIDRFTEGPACVVLFDEEQTVRAVIELDRSNSRENEKRRITEAINGFIADR